MGTRVGLGERLPEGPEEARVGADVVTLTVDVDGVADRAKRLEEGSRLQNQTAIVDGGR